MRGVSVAWKQNLGRSFRDYIQEEHGLDWYSKVGTDDQLAKDMEAGKDALE